MTEPEHDDAETVDASRRTYLAAERTYLAWWRAGLAAMAVALGVGRLLPDFTSGAHWPFVLLGTGFGVLALLFVGYGIARQRAVDRALHQGGFTPPGAAVLVVLAALGVILGVGTIALVLFEL